MLLDLGAPWKGMCLQYCISSISNTAFVVLSICMQLRHTLLVFSETPRENYN